MRVTPKAESTADRGASAGPAKRIQTSDHVRRPSQRCPTRKTPCIDRCRDPHSYRETPIFLQRTRSLDSSACWRYSGGNTPQSRTRPRALLRERVDTQVRMFYRTIEGTCRYLVADRMVFSSSDRVGFCPLRSQTVLVGYTTAPKPSSNYERCAPTATSTTTGSSTSTTNGNESTRPATPTASYPSPHSSLLERRTRIKLRSRTVPSGIWRSPRAALATGSSTTIEVISSGSSQILP